MVQFTKLRLSGFKSFVDHTEMPIEPGVTGIVGPNGCGKSNLVEALRWVMGETSAKRMRGGEMDDVIFGGSANRPARNVAEVSLTLVNDERNVPAQFNDHEELEVTRRIERGEGSNYRINGKDARARDVQLLFADAATGAHSTALVSQGRIGALINAKPTERRSLLEEAAGITGLHSRRHEAELRLRAAEANLSRLDDVIVTLESQLNALKKQARQASRYRNINDQIRRTEAILLHQQWVELDARVKDTAAALAAAEVAVIDATSTAAGAATAQGEAASVLPPLRQAEAEAAAELQRYTLARGALDQEEQRVESALADMRARLAQIDGDTARESALAEDAKAADSRLDGEEQELAGAAAGEAQAIAEASAAVAQAQAAVDAHERELGELTQQVAADDARAAALARRIGELDARIQRLSARAQEVAAERARLEEEANRDLEVLATKSAADEAQGTLERTQQEATEAEQARLSATAAEDEARQTFLAAQTARARIAAEAEALASLFATTDTVLWPPLVDKLTVDAGYETALGAALGDDLTASTDSGAPVFWDAPAEDADAPALPAGVESLAAHVRGAPALARRLRQVGVVADEAQGQALHTDLAQGQRLVTRAGALWRWDGFTVKTGTPTAAATRLAQRNRLDELTGQLAEAETGFAAAEQAFVTLRDRAVAAAEAERSRRAALQAAFAAASRARDAHNAAVQRVQATRSRLSALEEAGRGLAADIAEAEAGLGQSREEHAGLPDLAAARDRVAALRTVAAERRAELVDRKSAHDRLAREAEGRARRRKAIAEERASWSARAAAAARQLEAFAERRSHTESEIDRLAQRPAEIAEQRRVLLDHIDMATTRRRDAADRLAEAEAGLAAADRALKAAEQHLSETREARVRAEAQVEQVRQNAVALAERIRERLDCAPEQALELAELDPGADLPARDQVESKLARLTRERDGMGPVNLRAEAEAAELDQQITGLQSERSDLVNAIARLRQGIASLNREGRERLLAAFELVNGHFTDLFTRLFGGGRAHLALTEAEDPRVAGLEIMASPPGKRLQTLSLLSGGEQALTALALLFAVFLTNPAPICVLDEVDAPLDDANVERFCTLVGEMAHSSATRFLIITHHRLTMARMDRLFGVTMGERGISQLVSVDLERAAELRAVG